MAEQTRSTLKGYFNTGDIPTESQFADLIDSVPNITDEASTKWTSYAIYNDSYVPANNWVAYGSGGNTWAYTVTHNLGTTDFIPSFKLGGTSFSNPISADWDAVDFEGLRNYIQTTFSLTTSSPIVNTTTVTLVVNGTPTKPNIILGLRLLKV